MTSDFSGKLLNESSSQYRANSAEHKNDEGEDHRIFWIVPNYKTAPSVVNSEPLAGKEKFKVATEDAFDRGTFALAALFGGEAQLTNSSPSFGQGAKGYARYFGTSFSDWVIGNYMTEAIYPSILHQVPRYFRSGTGTATRRLGHAVSQLFWTRTDSGHMQFNFSEIPGNSTASAISLAYYPDNRKASDASIKLASQLGVVLASNILKEFWPEIKRTIFRKKD